MGRTGRPSAQILAGEQQSAQNGTGQANARTEGIIDDGHATSASGRECRGNTCADCPSCPANESLEITALAFFLTDDLLADPEARYLGVRVRELALLPGYKAIQPVSDQWWVRLAALCEK